MSCRPIVLTLPRLLAFCATLTALPATAQTLTVSTLAGSVFGYADGTGTAAQFGNTRSLAYDAAGNLYEADSYGHTVRKIAPSGVVTLLAGRNNVYGSADGSGPAATFSGITAMAMGPQQALYVYDYTSLRKVTLSGDVTTIAIGLRSGSTGLVVDAAGNAYTASSTEVDRISATGVVTRFATSPNFHSLQSLAADSQGNLYTIDVSLGASNIATVWEITPSGTVGAVPLQTGLSTGPAALAVDASGVLYAADSYGDTVVRLTGAGGIMAGALGQPGNKDGTGSEVRFRGPQGLAVGPQGQIAVADGGNYSIRVGTLPAQNLPSVAPNPAAHLINLSARAYATNGANALVAGFVVGGDPSETKPVLMRGIGPTLSQFGVANAMGKAGLTLYRSGAVPVASNDGWGTDPLLASTAAQVSAFALPANSGDSALVWSLYPGAYTVQVSDDTGAGGNALAEIYDVAPNDTVMRLLNISARSKIGAYPSGSLAGGFVISGTGSETVLIRGVGPTLSQFGISSPATAPVLMLFDHNGQIIAQNSGWPATAALGGGTVPLAQIFARVGAFSLPTGSADCAIVATLPAGLYTAHLAQAAGSSGEIGLLEIYEVPNP